MTFLPVLRYGSGHRKRWFKNPIPIGARPGEVIAADSTTINLLKLLLGAFRLKPGRHVILSDIHNFPTDLYAAECAADLLGGRQVRRVEASAIAGAIDKDTACVMLTHVVYRSGRIRDMNRVTAGRTRREP